MSRPQEGISPELGEWIARQRIFFVATAPLAAEGRLNCSPKGLDSLRILGPREVAYLDLTGSGIETIAHLRENGRIVLLLCAFEGPPRIVRLHGRGTVHARGSEEFERLRAHFPDLPGARAVIRVAVERVSTSCGFAVPLFENRGQRSELINWAGKKGAEGLEEYRRQKNARSIDGLPGWPPPGTCQGMEKEGQRT